MNYQAVFKRYEMKYLITCDQKARILDTITQYMTLDQYGRSTIRNVYFDTGNYQLIRNSIEKPTYKEKLRLRSYQKVASNETVFVELKKKYQSVVYKRRIPLIEEDAMKWLTGKTPCNTDCQISREIDYFLHFYKELHPVVFLSYEREAYYSNDQSDFRVTFDDNILCRESDLSLCSSVGGVPLLATNNVLMEIKCSGGIPMWMVHALSTEQIYKTSFSKYGTCYQTLIYPKTQGGIIYP